MEFFIIMYSVFFIFIFSGFLSFRLFKLLRERLYFNLLLGISIFLSILYFSQIDFKNKDHWIKLFLIFYTIIFLLIYRLVDNYYLKTYKRHLIFASKYNFPYDSEFDQQSFTEIFYQVIFAIFPFLIMILIDKYL